MQPTNKRRLLLLVIPLVIVLVFHSFGAFAQERSPSRVYMPLITNENTPEQRASTAQSLFAQPMAEGSSDYCYNWDFFNQTQLVVNDLHIVLEGPEVLTTVYLGGLNPFGKPQASSGLQKDGRHHLDFAGAEVVPGQMVHMGFCTDSAVANLVAAEGLPPYYWTIDGKPIVEPQLPAIGYHWRAVPLAEGVSSVEVDLTNTTAQDVAVKGILWTLVDKPIQLDDLNWEPLSGSLSWQELPLPEPVIPGTKDVTQPGRLTVQMPEKFENQDPRFLLFALLAHDARNGENFIQGVGQASLQTLLQNNEPSTPRDPFTSFVETKIEILAQPVAQGNALLHVSFPTVALRELPAVVEMPITGEKPATVRDDGREFDKIPGDGQFTGIIHLADDELALVSRFPNPFTRPPGLTHPVEFNEELMITDLAVVEDPTRTFDLCGNIGTPMGAWTFGKLMTEMSTVQDPSDFVLHWLETWKDDQIVNLFTAEERDAIQSIIDNWPKVGGKLDLAQAPMRLLAIVFRPDLRNTPGYSGGGAVTAGEGRFVFGVLDQDPLTPLTPCDAPRFTIILEYELLATNFCSVHDWGVDIHNLSTITNPSDYRDALQVLTDRFTLANVAPHKPNGSALNQLRTNEIHLTSPWQLREFNITPSGWMNITTVKQTPDPMFNQSIALVNFMNANQLAITQDRHIVPPTWNGAASDVPFFPAFVWNEDSSAVTPAVAPEVRHHFAFNTCNGCHFNETNNGGSNTLFTHISPRTAGVSAALSQFLQGPINVVDPRGAGGPWPHDEPGRRETDLTNLVNATCFEVGMVSAFEARVH